MSFLPPLTPQRLILDEPQIKTNENWIFKRKPEMLSLIFGGGEQWIKAKKLSPQKQYWMPLQTSVDPKNY